MSGNRDHRIVTHILTSEQLAAIGSVVVESTFCEETVERILWYITKLSEDQGKFFTQNIQMKSRLELLSDLGKPLLRSQKKRNELTKIISDLKIANEDRNIIVHGTWQTNGVGIIKVLQDGPEKHPPAISKKRRPKAEPATKSASEIEKTALAIAELTHKLDAFSYSWRRVPSPDKQFERLRKSLQSPARTPPKSQSTPRRPRASAKSPQTPKK